MYLATCRYLIDEESIPNLLNKQAYVAWMEYGRHMQTIKIQKK